jgi:hypothetical protein
MFTPLEMLAWAYLRFDQLSPAASLLDAYDGFLAILDDAQARDELQGLTQDQVATNQRFQRVRTLGHQFQDALNELFFSDDAFGKLTRAYGVF